MKDMLGNTLEVGHYVIHTGGQYKGMAFGRIIRITAKEIKVVTDHAHAGSISVMKTYQSVLVTDLSKINPTLKLKLDEAYLKELGHTKKENVINKMNETFNKESA